MSQTKFMPGPLPINNDDGVMEHYVEGPVGVNFVNGNLHIDFGTLRANHNVTPPNQYRQITLRLVLPLAGAVEIQQTISRIMGALQNQGVIKPVSIGTETQQ